MRSVIFHCLIVLTLKVTAGFYNETDYLLSKYVRNQGFDYELMLANEDTSMLDAIIQKGKYQSTIVEDKNEQIATYINLYNLLVIQKITRNMPISSPMEVPNFFENKIVNLGGADYSLNEIENDLIRGSYKDPRIHFALVCGARSCPPIQPFAYVGDQLDEQLNSVTKEALNDAEFVQLNNNKVGLSQIFIWYKVDFPKDIIEWINLYRDEPLSKEIQIEYYTYDWTINSPKDEENTSELSNVQAYTPSVLLKKGQNEFLLFNNLYTQTAFRNENGEKVDLNQRATYNTLFLTYYHGFSKSARWNLGADVLIKSVYLDEKQSNPAEVFRLNESVNGRTRITAIGPKVKFVPFKNIQKFSIQSAFWFPIGDSLEFKSDRPWLDWERFTWWNQFFYDHQISQDFQLFFSGEILARFQKWWEIDASSSIYEPVQLNIPLGVFLSYFPTGKTSIYGQFQYAPTITSWPNYFIQMGLGGKYQITKTLQLEASYTNFVASINNGAGTTYNFGLRYIR
jgi:hypothetical protein